VAPKKIFFLVKLLLIQRLKRQKHLSKYHLKNKYPSLAKNITIIFMVSVFDGLIQTRGNVARVKKSARTRAEGE
jgi:hypothetical protein